MVERNKMIAYTIHYAMCRAPTGCMKKSFAPATPTLVKIRGSRKLQMFCLIFVEHEGTKTGRWDLPKGYLGRQH